tara:strand:+ start:154 stop:534 length:381 start_codon:yes stop_codon:yes gene_type:complete
MSETGEVGQLQNFSVDQAAGAVVLVLGAIAGLLQVIWMSKCHCKVNLCWLFRCERRPPSEEEMANLKSSMDKSKDKRNQKEILKKENEILKKEEEILIRTPSREIVEPVPERHPVFEPEPEPQIIP